MFVVICFFCEGGFSLLIRLEDVCLGSRYLPGEYEKGEAEELVKFAEEAHVRDS